MSKQEEVRGDEGDRRAMREIFAETGHSTLNALLIVSGGATVTFMTFLGGAIQQPNLVALVGSAATRGFADAIEFFFRSLLYAVAAHGTTYASHAAFHYSATFRRSQPLSRVFNLIGQLFMWGTVLVCALCFWQLLNGGFSAIGAFGFVADALTKGVTTATKP